MSNRGYTVVDRRGLSGGKNLTNRQRFIQRTKDDLRRSVKDGLQDRSITSDEDQEVHVPTDGIQEPWFHHDHTTGDTDMILPGNKDFIVGDIIRKPDPNGGSGSGQGEASDSGEGNDDFDFMISKSEYYDILFEDLELPDMVKESEKQAVSFESKRAGFTNVGSPANLDLLGTMKKSLGRRIALKKPKMKELAKYKEEFNALEKKKKLTEDELSRKKELLVLMQELDRKATAVPYIDPIDLRFRNYEKKPIPKSQAVMFCVDGDTEYLTPVGWKKIRDYDGEMVAQYTESGEMEFVKPNAYVKNDYDGDFIHFSAQGIDQLLTPEHRVIYRTATGNLKEMLASEWEENHNKAKCGSRAKIPTHFKYVGGNGLDLSDDEIKLHIAFKADGTYQREHLTRMQFIFKKERKVKQLIELLESLNIEYHYSENDGFHRIYADHGVKIDKGYGSEWYSATDSQLSLISQEVLKWDGYDVRGTFSAKNKSDVDYIQFVWASQGFGTNLFHSAKVWVVTRCSYSERSMTSNTPNKASRVTLDEKHSYCFSVPSTMLVLRRNDNIFITGNCVMDVSGSMGRHEKDLAKRFYMLLYLFLQRKYRTIDVVFIRHHSVASECTEEEFFYSRETGGTVVSSGFEELSRIQKERYPEGEWNIYCAQASDGDNFNSDNDKLTSLLTEEILPMVQYFCYVEVTQMSDRGRYYQGLNSMYGLWPLYQKIRDVNSKMVTKKVSDPNHVYGIFRELFSKDKLNE